MQALSQVFAGRPRDHTAHEASGLRTTKPNLTPIAQGPLPAVPRPVPASQLETRLTLDVPLDDQDAQTQRSLGLAFVTFRTAGEASKALELLNDHQVQGRKLRCAVQLGNRLCFLMHRH